MMADYGVGALGGVVLIDPATGLPYKAEGGGGGGVPISVPGDIDATGTPSATTYLRGDGTWATPTNTTYVSGSASNPHTSPDAARNSTVPKNFWQCAIEPVHWLDGDEWVEVAL